jgi:hypothetical protein
MFNTIALKRGALALLLASAVVGAADAQTLPPDARRSAYCNGGLFTLTEEAAKFHIALDDDSTEPGIFVLMQFINQSGAVVKSRTANIGPGGSATLEYRGSGLYRVHAEIFESSSNVNFSDRRTLLPSMERTSAAPSTPGSSEGFRPIGPPVWCQAALQLQ